MTLSGARPLLAAGDDGARPGAASLPQTPEARRAPCILVAEDNPVNQMVVERFLAKRGYRVRLADDGLAALAAYERDAAAIDLILMDCEMPQLDGFAATRRIRRLERQRQLTPVPIVALTAHNLDEQRQRGTAAGMDAFLGKPLDQAQLYHTLDALLRRPPA